MHGSVLQNDKYISFANNNTVEVMAISRLDEAVSKGDKQSVDEKRKTETYDGKDDKGNSIKLMKEWPNLTYDQLIALNSSPAGQYNKTGRIPYTSVINPFTLVETKQMPGGQGIKTIEEAVLEAEKSFAKEHPPIKRTDLTKCLPNKALDPIEYIKSESPKKDVLNKLLKVKNVASSELEKLIKEALAK